MKGTHLPGWALTFLASLSDVLSDEIREKSDVLRIKFDPLFPGTRRHHGRAVSSRFPDDAIPDTLAVFDDTFLKGPELVVLVPSSWPPGEERHNRVEKELRPVVLFQGLNGEKSEVSQVLLLLVIPYVNLLAVLLALKVWCLDVKTSVVTR